MYVKYLKDILNNKRPLPTTEVIKLTEEYSAAILNTSRVKKKDSGCATIDCSIGSQNFENMLCDLRASVSVMPKKVFDKLNYSTLTPTSMCLQLADQSVRYPAGITKNNPVMSTQNFRPVTRTHAASQKGLLDGAVDPPSFSAGMVDPVHSSRDVPVNLTL